MREKKKQQLQVLMDQAVEKQQIAGMNMMVVQNGQEVLYLESGFADRAKQKEIKRDTIFRLFSLTKPVTAAAVMLLFQRGALDLADPVSKYIPGFADQKVSVPGGLEPVWHQVTIYHLLSMTGGLTYGGNSSATEYAIGNVLEEQIGTYEYRSSHDYYGACGQNWQMSSGVSAWSKMEIWSFRRYSGSCSREGFRYEVQ